MRLLLLTLLLCALTFITLKAALLLFKRYLPEGRAMYDSVDPYLWVPAVVVASALAVTVTRWLG